MRRLASGLVIGASLSMLRAPLGIDLVQWPAVDARVAYGTRALALGLAAIALSAAGRRTLSGGFIAAIALGFALHGLVLANAWSPSSTAQLWITGLACCAAAIWLGRGASAAEPIDPPHAHSAGFFERVGIAIASAGLALCTESIARHVRLFGAGLAQDDALFGTLVLAGLAAGAGAFGWLVRAHKLRGLALPVALAVATAGGYASLRVITSAATWRGLDVYLRSYGLDSSLHGTIPYDALIGASCFVVPALIAGAGLAATHTREELFSALIGAAVGIVLVPSLLATDASALATDKALFSAQLIPIATFVAVAGAALALLTVRDRKVGARWTALVLALSPCALPLVVTVRPQFVLSPWQSFPVLPILAVEIPEGLVTFEPARGGMNIATLDRRAITPGTAGLPSDLQRLSSSMEMLSPARRMRGAIQVLLLGQLTPERALVLTNADATRIDRSAAWSPAMARLEEQLFGSVPRPAGEILSLDEARRRIDAGLYDLVVIPPVAGDAPMPHLDAPDKTTVVAWLEIDEPLSRRALGERVVLSAHGFDDPCLGVTLHATLPDAPAATSPRVLAAGAPRAAPIPLLWLSMRAFDRISASRAATAERLRDAALGGADAELTAGLEFFYRAQVHSSPFESSDQQIELPAEALEHLRSAALAAPPDLFVRQLWEAIGRVLVGKRWIEQIYTYVAPIAAANAPWPVLEHVLARADMESLEPESAIERLTKLCDIQPDQVEHWYWRAEAEAQAGRNAAASSSLRRASALRPDNRGIRRKLAITLLRAGDPDGREVANEILRTDPDDDELKGLLDGEAHDEPPRGFVPDSGERHDH